MFASVEGGGECVVEYGSTMRDKEVLSYPCYDFVQKFVRRPLEPEPLPNPSLPILDCLHLVASTVNRGSMTSCGVTPAACSISQRCKFYWKSTNIAHY